MTELVELLKVGGTIVASVGGSLGAVMIGLRKSEARHKKLDNEHDAREAEERERFRKGLFQEIDRLNGQVQRQTDRHNQMMDTLAHVQRDLLNCEMGKVYLYSQINDLRLQLGLSPLNPITDVSSFAKSGMKQEEEKHADKAGNG